MSSYSLGPMLIALGFGILVAPFVVLVFLAIGPVGWVLVGGSIMVVGIVVSLRESPGYDDVDHQERTNCDACGARIDADACDHFGATR
jgi:hypothetical protein